jgi:hypothetical protein
MSQSLYLPIKLNNTLPKKTGVFIPEHFQPAAAVNMIVYFHGWIIADCETKEDPFLDKGMEYYWGTPYFKCLRDELDARKVNAILVAPTFALRIRRKPAASYGNLNAAGKLDFLIDETLSQLKASGALPATAQAGNVILSGHSAGGLPMLTILETTNALKPNIAECWGFECLYFGTGGWNTWLSANPNKRFRHFRRSGEQAEATEELEPRGNFIDVAEGECHCTLVKEYWRAAIDASPTLNPTGAIA